MQPTRRALFGSTLLFPAAATATEWSSQRRHFLLANELLYFNAANIAPCPQAVLQAHARQLQDFQANPAFQNREQYKELAERVRERVARYLHAPAQGLALTRNTSESNNLIAQGVKLKAGDEVLITSHNHPSNTASWQLRASQSGARVVIAETPIDAKTPGEILDSLSRLVTARTRVIAVSHFTNTTGLLYPVKALSELAHRAGAWLHVDGAQSFGWMRLNLVELGVDSYTGSFHKWPMGPLESGMLYVNPARLEEITPAILSVDYWSEKPAGARKFEMLGQRDDAKLAGLEKTMEFLESLGAAAIELRVLSLAGRLREKAGALAHLEVRGSGAAAVSGPVVKIRVKGREVGAVYERLWSRHHVACAKTDFGPMSGLRFSPHVYNSESEIDAVVDALRAEA
jgi:selenocysteine lyase/cysteine desulfurase